MSKRILKYLFALNLMKLTYVIQVYQSMFSVKNDIKRTNILPTGSHKSFSIHYVLQGEIFKAYFNIFILH